MAEIESSSPVPDHPVTETHVTAEAGDENKRSTDNEAPTPYMEMCAQANKIPSTHNILAALSSWLTLAGFIVLPGTFTSLKNSTTLRNSKGGEIIEKAVQNIQLLPLAGCMFLIGIIGSCYLWRRWCKEYVWLIGQIFLPGLLNSLVALLSTLVNVMGGHDNHWSITAKITLVLSSICTGSMLVLFSIYSWLLERIKTSKDREVARPKKSEDEKEVL